MLLEQQMLLFQPYSRVFLRDLKSNEELNGQKGAVLPQSLSQFPDVAGCMKVRLESGREVAVRPSNLSLVVTPSAPAVNVKKSVK